MPPKPKPDHELVRWLEQSPDGQLYWTDSPSRNMFTKVIAYGWSDGVLTWGPNRV